MHSCARLTLVDEEEAASLLMQNEAALLLHAAVDLVDEAVSPGAILDVGVRNCSSSVLGRTQEMA